MGRQNPCEIAFKDISEFDGQNPIIGSLLAEIESKKLTDEAVRKFLDGAPSTKDLERNKGLENFKKFKRKLAAKNPSVAAKLLLNNGESDASDDNNNEDS